MPINTESQRDVIIKIQAEYTNTSGLPKNDMSLITHHKTAPETSASDQTEGSSQLDDASSNS